MDQIRLQLQQSQDFKKMHAIQKRMHFNIHYSTHDKNAGGVDPEFMLFYGLPSDTVLQKCSNQSDIITVCSQKTFM